MSDYIAPNDDQHQPGEPDLRWPGPRPPLVCVYCGTETSDAWALWGPAEAELAACLACAAWLDSVQS